MSFSAGFFPPSFFMKTGSDGEEGEKLFSFFDSWIVNHINLLSYRHTGVSCDLCGFYNMALLARKHTHTVILADLKNHQTKY